MVLRLLETPQSPQNTKQYNFAKKKKKKKKKIKYKLN